MQTKLAIMRTKSPVRYKSNNFTKLISSKNLTSLALQTGFSKRRPKKISALAILISYMDFINHNSFSFHSWSIQLSRYLGKRVSKQAIFKRIDATFIDFLQAVLAQILHKQFKNNVNRSLKLFESFPNVFLQDATHFSLPLHLAKLFPGNNTHGATRAVAKIVTIFNLKKGCFSLFSLTNFLQSDAASANLILRISNTGDLIIRDLGYFVMDGFEQIKKQGIYFLSRYKLNVAIYHCTDGQLINLTKLLKKKGYADNKVLLSSIKPIEVRLIAEPLPIQVANERRRKARADKRNKRTNHSKEYYYLLGFAIYVTNVEKKVWTRKDVCCAYRCRWNIEILFKSWKSHLNAAYTSPDRYATEVSIKAHFYLLLIYVSAFIMPTLVFLEKEIRKQNKKIQISILKLTKFIANNFLQILTQGFNKQLLETIVYYTKYDHRVDRKNFVQYAFNES